MKKRVFKVIVKALIESLGISFVIFLLVKWSQDDQIQFLSIWKWVIIVTFLFINFRLREDKETTTRGITLVESIYALCMIVIILLLGIDYKQVIVFLVFRIPYAIVSNSLLQLKFEAVMKEKFNKLFKKQQ
jgi:FtsH-binding integral membrane protein